MRVRFGYVAIAMRLDKVTSSSPVTYKKYSSIESERERLSLLKRVTQSNLIDLIKILKYNIEMTFIFIASRQNSFHLPPIKMWYGIIQK